MQNKIINIAGLEQFLSNIKTYITNTISNKQDTLTSGVNIKTINNESVLGEGNLTVKNLIEVTYNELVTLRNNKQLIPGRLYKITDYSTIITGLNITSAEHNFNIIVEATDIDKLSENVKATIHKADPNKDVIILDTDIQYNGDFYYHFNWKTWPNENLPQDIKNLFESTPVVNRQIFGPMNLQAGELRLKMSARKHRNVTATAGKEYIVKVLGIDLCKDINENDTTSWDKHIISKDYHRTTLVYDANTNNVNDTDVEYILNIPEEGEYTVCIAIDNTEDINTVLESELGVYGQIYKLVEDTYFTNSKIDAWELKYSIDNDRTRFLWADPTNGKGVIYYLKDEYGNECPYDFKNILFNGYYTFSYTINDTIFDGSVNYGHLCYNNKIQAAYNSDGIRMLNDIVFKNTSNTSNCINNYFESNCTHNTFGDSCLSNTFGSYCQSNTFGTHCQYNTFDDYCQSNTFGNYLQSSTFGVYCQSNTLGSYIIRTTFGKQCLNNKFTNTETGNGSTINACRMIKLGDQCNGVNLYTQNSSYPNNWMQNISIANQVSGNISIETINNSRTLYITKDANGNIRKYYESDLIDRVGYPDANVAAVDASDTIDDVITEIDYSKEYFTVEALEDGLTAKLSTNACEYRVDDGDWNTLNAGTDTVSINIGQTLLFRAELTPALYNGIGTFTFSKKCNLKGNIMSLLYKDDFIDKTDLTGKNYTFYNLFKNNTNIVNANELILPATTLANFCYSSMFEGCTGLSEAPELPATTLKDDCYKYMFFGCTGLTTAPELPATTLISYCYSYMFSGCTGLTTAPELSATTLAQYCYGSMFQGCTGLTTAPELPATTLAFSCYQYMFYGCTGLTIAPELPATILANACYYYMFYNCTGLTIAPELPATELKRSCYEGMFKGCTGLTAAPELPATTLTDYCYRSMFYDCTGLTTAPELPATMLVNLCYQYMFYGCSNLNYIKDFILCKTP